MYYVENVHYLERRIHDDLEKSNNANLVDPEITKRLDLMRLILHLKFLSNCMCWIYVLYIHL